MNKRPLPFALAGFVLGEVWIGQFHGTVALTALLIMGVICLTLGLWNRGGPFLYVFLFVGIGMILGGTRQYEWNQDIGCFDRWKGIETCLIQGEIEEVIEKETSYAIVMGGLFINGHKQGGKLLVYLDETEVCTLGSHVLVDGQIEDFQCTTNPGGFDLKQYRAGRGILGVVYGGEIQGIKIGKSSVKEKIREFRQRTADYLKEHMDIENSGVGIAMVLGDKSGLTEENKQLYELAGISHVLAVSGLHMSLLGAGMYKLFRKMGIGYGISAAASVPCIVGYAIMAGMSSSCLRAGIMLLIYLIAEWKGWYYDLPSSLSLAALWLLMEIPERLWDSGFLLSFGAMIAVGIIRPWLDYLFPEQFGYRLRNEDDVIGVNIGDIIEKIRQSFLSSVVITVFTLPLSLYFFYGFSLAGLVLNLIVIPLMSLIVPFLFIGGLGWISYIPGFLSGCCITLANGLLNLYDFLCQGASKVSFAYVQTGFRGIEFAIIYYLILFSMIGFVWFIRNKIWDRYMRYTIWDAKLTLRIFSKRFSIVSFLTVITMIFVLSSFVVFTGRKDSFLTVLDVGQGDGILYRSGSGNVCMIDGGSTSEKQVGQYVIKPALEYYGISEVDYWFVSHLDEDHISGLMELLELGYPVKYLILPYRKESNEKVLLQLDEIEILALHNGTKLLFMSQGDKLTLEDTVITCLYPEKKIQTENENENSLVLLLETMNQQFLLTGDIEKTGEDEMVKYLKSMDIKPEKEQILKVGHHGSANSTGLELLDAIQPDSAIISCALKNSYGHPAEETIARIEDAESDIYYTMKHGAIEVRCGENALYYGYKTIE